MSKFIKMETELEGVYIIDTLKFEDERGYFSEIYQKDCFKELGIQDDFIQENISYSKKGTLRGLHFQTKKKQGKLLRVLKGKIYDVIVDLRENSKTYGQHIGIELQGQDQKLLWIPPGCAHGFLSLDEKNVVQYQCTENYAAEYESGILWSDTDLNIDWKLKEYGILKEELIISEKDRRQKSFEDYEKRKKEERVLILGGNGQLGKAFQKFIQKKKIRYQAVDIDTLDITDEKKCREFLEKNFFHCVINCAAYTDVDKAELELERCKTVNADAIKLWIDLCRERQIPFITFSTDFVFDGTGDEPYSEEKDPNPISWYGKTKLEGEKNALCYEKALVIRSSWLFSNEGTNFCKKVLTWSKQKKEIHIVDDQISTPTYVRDLVYFTWLLYEKACFGLYHMSSSGECSKYDLAKYLLSSISWNGILERASSEEFENRAERPKYSKLYCMKLQREVGKPLPYWKKAVQHFLKGEL
ncbi:dTDP-4-dehydrorhamnose 3,5-epimerase [Fusobacterium gonidiaformans 3-1-5R]|uniref:dTDP-4-dehydrorhamnose reductase n=2 Tax=Fusobacterium TaxID=848 RepID=E5BE28_9FUSO|nr:MULTISPECIES: dTDP-4-dehydrorhamnose reductase [Fusobacterium]EFS21304.1 dTDP-4-dehydrorhamnose 3,5-epimerase [Fusobacterium gonidiaformans 3-1-5R]KXA15565.1 dTDP-4-dehydrorhamnose 3,5-epimerase [Fusobacterium equinum]